MAVGNKVLPKYASYEEQYEDYSYFYKLHLNLFEKKKGSPVVQPEKSISYEGNPTVWNQALESAIQNLSLHICPHYTETQQFLNYVLSPKVSVDSGLVEEFFWKLLLYFPAGPKMFHYYSAVLLKHCGTLNKKGIQSQILFFAVIEALGSCFMKKTKSVIQSNIKKVETSEASPKGKPTKAGLEVFSQLKKSERIKRCFIALKFMCNILETDFMFWVNLKRGKSSTECRLLISHLFWPEGKTIGVITEEVNRVLDLLKLVSWPVNGNFQITSLVKKIVNLVGEVIRWSDNLAGVNYPFFGTKTQDYVGLITTVLYGSIARKGVRNKILQGKSLIVNFKPHWLRLLLCSRLLSLITNSDCLPDLTGAYDLLEYIAYTEGRSDKGLRVSDKCKNHPNSDLIQEFKKSQIKNDNTLLHSACEAEDLEKVKALLTLPELDVNATNSKGWTALHVAASQGNASIVQELLSYQPPSRVLQKPVNVRAGDPSNFTPLMLAVIKGHARVSELLLKHAGSLLLRDANKFNQTPLELCHTEEVENVLEYYEKNDVWTCYNWKNIDYKPEFKEIVLRICVEMVQAYFCTFKTWEIHRALRDQEKNSIRKSARQFQMNSKIDYERYEKDITENIRKLKDLAPKLREVQEFTLLADIYNQLLSRK